MSDALLIRASTHSRNQVRLEPLRWAHEADLRTATQDGALWHLVYASAPEPDKVRAYIEAALHTPNRIAFAVIDEKTGKAVGSTSFYGMDPAVRRVYIGYTWYAKSVWRGHINTACKLMLLTDAFENADCRVVAWHTDILNIRSQAAIERLGAKKDGILRGDRLRRDGSVRDTVVYSMSAAEWPAAKKRLTEKQYEQHRTP